MAVSTRLAKILLFGSIIGVALIYLVFANTLSETDMVMLSYIWVPLAVVGAAVLIKKNHTLKFALYWFVISLLLMFVFFVQIFPML